MMKTVTVMLLVTAFGLTAMAQKKEKYKEIKITKTSEVINVSADSLWRIVGPGWQDVGLWLKGITRSEGSGAPEFKGALCSERICEVDYPGIDELQERITLYDENSREIAYEGLHGLPGFVTYSSNHWTVTDMGPGKSTATMSASLHVKGLLGKILGAKMEKNFTKSFGEIFSELKQYAETGEISEAKREADRKAQRKYKKLAMVQTSGVINVSADSLWQIVGPGFHNVGDWVTVIDDSEGSGEPEFDGAVCSERICDVHFGKYDKVTERIIEYNELERQMAYRVISGMPGFVLYADNRWTVRDMGENRSMVRIEPTMHLKKFMGFLLGGMMKKQFTKAGEELFEELKLYAETGELSEAKKARKIELGQATAR